MQTQQSSQPVQAYAPVTALVLSDRLLSLAQDADRAGLFESASHLVGLAHAVFDEQPRRHN